jgi:hypothetical protein
VFPGNYSVTVVDPVTKSVICTVPEPVGESLIMGCDGPSGKLFVPTVPFWGHDPAEIGVLVLH